MLDPEKFQTQLLMEDNRKMKADRYAWRVEMGLVGKYIEGVDEGGEEEGALAGNYGLDRTLEEKAALKVERETETFGKAAAS